MFKFEHKDPNNLVVIYHANCSDGFGAAWSAWKALGNEATYIAGSYNDTTVPDVTGKDVVILDFSYPRDVLIKMRASANSLIVLDHHKTAFDNIGDLEYTHFDMNKSGAMLAWEYFHEGKAPPRFIEYIQDYDLWKFNLPNSKAFSTVFYSVPFEFEEYDKFLNDSKIESTILNGQYILSYQADEVQKIIKNAFCCKFVGHPAMVVNSCIWQSEIGSKIAEMCNGVGIVWYHDYTNNCLKVSLRTCRPDINVGKLAEDLKVKSQTHVHNPGGHPGAGGFSLAISDSILDVIEVDKSE